jgi:hypothetical protein
MAAIPTTEGPLVDQRYALKWFGFGLEGHAEALHPISVADNLHYLLNGPHTQTNIYLCNPWLQCVSMTDQHNIGGWFHKGGLRLVLVAGCVRITPVLTVNVNRDLLLSNH